MSHWKRATEPVLSMKDLTSVCFYGIRTGSLSAYVSLPLYDQKTFKNPIRIQSNSSFIQIDGNWHYWKHSTCSQLSDNPMWPPEPGHVNLSLQSLSVPRWWLVVGAFFPLGPVWLWLAIWYTASLPHCIATYKNTSRSKWVRNHPSTGKDPLFTLRAIICRKVQVRCCCPCRAQWVQLLRWKKSCNRLWRASGVEYTWLAEGASGISGPHCNAGLTSSLSTMCYSEPYKVHWKVILIKHNNIIANQRYWNRDKITFRHRKTSPGSLGTEQGNYLPDNQWVTANNNELFQWKKANNLCCNVK